MQMYINTYLSFFIILLNGFALCPTQGIAQNRFLVNDTLKARKLEDSAIVMFNNNDKMATLALLKQGLIWRKKINFAPKTAVNLWTTAFVHYDLKEYDKALQYLAQARKTDATNHRIDNLCGQIYRIRGEYILAKQAFLRSIRQAFANNNYNKAIEFHLDAVLVCTELNELDTAIIIAKNAIKMNRVPLTNGAMYTNLGNIYKNKKDWQQALFMYKTTISIGEQARKKMTDAASINQNSLHQATALANTGVVYRKQQKYAEALVYTKKCLDIRQKTQDTTALAESYGLMADIYTLQKNFEKAHEYYNISIRLLCPDFGLSQPKHALPSIAVLRNAPRNTQLLVQLADKINCQNQENGSFATIKAYHLLDNYIDLLREDQISADTKLFWREKVRSIYQDAIALCYKLNKADEAF
jgi:tetratricopeptide (TPR) repeat protein